MINRQNNNQGFTLLEIALVLAIVGLMVGGIWIAMASVFEANKTNALIKDANQVIQNTRTLFAGQPRGLGATFTFTTTNAITAGIIPADMISATAGVISTPFAADQTQPSFSIQSASAVAPELLFTFGNDQLAENSMPTGACVQLLLALGGSLETMKKLGITFLSGGAGVGTDLTGGGTVPVTALTAAAQCTAAGNNNAVYVHFNVY